MYRFYVIYNINTLLFPTLSPLFFHWSYLYFIFFSFLKDIFTILLICDLEVISKAISKTSHSLWNQYCFLIILHRHSLEWQRLINVKTDSRRILQRDSNTNPKSISSDFSHFHFHFHFVIYFSSLFFSCIWWAFDFDFFSIYFLFFCFLRRDHGRKLVDFPNDISHFSKTFNTQWKMKNTFIMNCINFYKYLFPGLGSHLCSCSSDAFKNPLILIFYNLHKIINIKTNGNHLLYGGLCVSLKIKRMKEGT